MFLLLVDLLRHGYREETMESSDKAQIGEVGFTHQNLLGYAPAITGNSQISGVCWHRSGFLTQAYLPA